MNLLALDTATEACSAAVWVDGVVHALDEVVGRDHTQRLIPVVTQVLAAAGLRYADLDGLVCGVGPGSFAGVRIGVSFTKGVALAHDLPVLGLTSLELLARAALTTPGADPVLVAIDARMGEVYFQAFEQGAGGVLRPLGEARVSAPSAVVIPAGPARWQAVGTGWGTYARELAAAVPGVLGRVDGQALPSAAAAMGHAAGIFAAATASSADALQPVYLRNQVALTLVEQRQLRARAR